MMLLGMADWLDLGLRVLTVVATGAVMVLGWMFWALRKEMLTRDDFNKWATEHRDEHTVLDVKLGAGEVRFTRLETTLEHLPRKEDIDQVRGEVSRVSGSVQAMGASLDALRQTMAAVAEQLNTVITHHIK